MENQQSAGKPTPSCVDDVWPGIYLDHGAMFEERFRSLGRLEDLENAIFDYQKAAEFTEPIYDVYRSTVLCRLEAALKLHLEKAAKLRPNDSLLPTYYYKLGDAFLERFYRFSRPEDLDSAISGLQKSVEFTPDGRPDKPTFLEHLQHAFDSCFELVDSPEDLDSAISTLRSELELTPDSHQVKPTLLSHVLSASITLKT